MFQYYNAEPSGEKLEDCVIRAISLALQLPYYEVVKMLTKNGKYYDCDEICLTCYEKMLDDLGYHKQNANGRLVKDIANLGSVVLIRIVGHLTCAIDGVIYDIWDCSEKEADCYWVINRGGLGMLERVKEYLENIDLNKLGYEEIKTITETMVMIEKYESDKLIQHEINERLNVEKAPRV